jgi:hypothetical protein
MLVVSSGLYHDHHIYGYGAIMAIYGIWIWYQILNIMDIAVMDGKKSKVGCLIYGHIPSCMAISSYGNNK